MSITLLPALGTPLGVHFDCASSVLALSHASLDFPLLEVVPVQRYPQRKELTLQPQSTSPLRGTFWLNKTAATPADRDHLEKLAEEFNRAPREYWPLLLVSTTEALLQDELQEEEPIEWYLAQLRAALAVFTAL